MKSARRAKNKQPKPNPHKLVQAPLSLADRLARQRVSLSQNGTLDLTGISETSLASLSTQQALKTLILTDSAVYSLDTLKPQPFLRSLIADRTRINSLEGLGGHVRLESISFVDTPISKHDNFRLACIIALGNRLTSINSTPVTRNERKQAKAFPKVAQQLVSSGWMPSYPPPSENDLKLLARQFGVEVPPEFSDDIFGAKYPASESLVPQNENSEYVPETFAEKCAAILQPLGYGIRFGTQMDNDIVNAVGSICRMFTTLENAQQSNPNEEEDELQPASDLTPPEDGDKQPDDDTQ